MTLAASQACTLSSESVRMAGHAFHWQQRLLLLQEKPQALPFSTIAGPTTTITTSRARGFYLRVSARQQRQEHASQRPLSSKRATSNTPTVYEEEIYSIGQGPELSLQEIVELANTEPKDSNKQKRKSRTSDIKAEKVVPRSTHKILQVIAGKASRKKLLSVADTSVRPMMEVVRGAVFDILQARLHGFKSFSSGRWLDLYSGTGSVGIEALSRGCTSAHFVEVDPWITSEVLKPNLQATDFLQHSVVHVMKVESFLQQTSNSNYNLGGFDFISVTPPYEAVDYNVLLGQLSTSPVLQKDTFVVVEYPSKLDILERCGPLQKILHRRYGRTHLAIYGPEWALKD